MKTIKGQKFIDFQSCSTVQEVQECFLLEYKIHGESYTKYLTRIADLLLNCDSYRELGTNQGASAFVAVATNIKFMDLIDITFEGMISNKHILETYGHKNNIKINFYETNSLDAKIDYEVDFLFVDSLHRPEHVKKEIEKYEPLTKKFIMFHDTTLYPKIYSIVLDFLKNNKNWELFEVETEMAGHTIIKRI